MLDLLWGPGGGKRAGTFGWWGHLWSSGRVRTQAGVDVDEELALTCSAFWSGVRLLSETTAGLPLCVYEKDDDNDREQVHAHGLSHVLKVSPNPTMGAFAFREGRTAHQILWGQGFAEIERGGFTKANPWGEVVNLWPIHPCRVRPVRAGDADEKGRSLADAGFDYMVKNNEGSFTAMRADEMLHIPGPLSEDGIWGKSVVAHARQSLGLAIATERYGSTWFGSGGRPRAVVFANGLKDKQARDNFRESWREVHGSPDSGEIAILPIDAKLEQITVPPEDSQFLETRRFGVNEIARWLRIPVHLLGELEGGASYASIEVNSMEFVIYGLMPWLRRWEEQIALKLIAPEDRGRVFVEHNLAGLLRGDTPSRFAAYNVALQAGFMTRNEVRRLENLPGLGPDGDKLFVPLNQGELHALATGQAPVATAGATASVPALPAPAADPTTAAAGEPGADLLDVPQYRQQGSSDCGAACTHIVADYLGVGEGREEGDYIRELDTTATDGTTPGSIVRWLNNHGLITTSGPGMSLDDLAGHFRAGRPVIALIQSPEDDPDGSDGGHYVVVIGVGLGQVFVQDPVDGRTLMPAAEFLDRWHDEGGREDDGVEYVRYAIAVGKPAVNAEEVEEETEPPAEEAEETEENAAIQQAAAASEGADGARRAALPAPPVLALPAPPAADALKAAARGALVDALARMFGKEAAAATRAAASPDFPEWLGKFYGKHEPQMARALLPAVGVLACAGRTVPAAGVAARLAAESAALLRQAYDTETRERFAELLAGWPAGRAERTADAILRGDYDHADRKAA